MAARVLDDCVVAWRALPRDPFATHLACVPMADADEAAIIVNALQRHATVVVQKSIAEGFGLTVAEAMWKHRPVIASAVGGITDQIVDGETGCLLGDPGDLGAFAATARHLLLDPDEQERMGRDAHARVLEQFLPDRHLEHWTKVIARPRRRPPTDQCSRRPVTRSGLTSTRCIGAPSIQVRGAAAYRAGSRSDRRSTRAQPPVRARSNLHPSLRRSRSTSSATIAPVGRRRELGARARCGRRRLRRPP